MYIRQSLGASSLGLALECDLTTSEDGVDGVDVARALVFQKRAKFIDPHMKNLKGGIREEHRTLSFNADMKKGSTEEMLITHICSPDQFFIRKNYLQVQYDKLAKDLDGSYDIKDRSNTVFCPEVGMVVACNTDRCSEEAGGGGWRRGVVVALAGGLRLLLSLPDSGHQLTLHVSRLRTLHHRFYTIKALAVECHLSLISPTSTKWSKASVLSLKQYMNRALQAYVTDLPTRHRSMGVVLYDHTDPAEVVCINEDFIKLKYAVNIGAITFQLPNAPKFVQDKAPTRVRKEKKPEIRTLKRESVAEKLINENNLEVKVDRGPVKLEVKILSNHNPSQLYVSLVSQQDTLLQLYKNMQEFYDDTPPGKEEWQPEQRCCAFDNKSKTWRRAVVLQIVGERAHVFHTDFAVADDVPLTDLRVLHPQFQTVLDGAFKCHLMGIMPAGGSEWPGITCEHLNELIDNYNRFFITKKGQVKDKSMPVELWVYHVTPGGPLDPDKGEWRLLNSKLVQQGLAIPDRDTADDPIPEDTLSLLAATGTVSEWLQLRPTAKPNLGEPAANEPEVEVESPSPTPQRVDPTPPKDWIPAGPVDKPEFMAVPTFVDNEGHIYLHDVCNEDLLDILKKSLDSRFKNTKSKDVSWVMGQPCIALYGLDDHFYRGRVHQAFNDSTVYTVEFVDYGNIEVCAVENMRNEMTMARTPILALKCALSGVTLVGGKGNTRAIEYIRSLIVDEECLVKVLGQDGDILQIELLINNINISDLLVDAHYATYKESPNTTLNDSKGSISKELDSDPDYIIKEDSISDKTPNITDKPHIDWNKMIDEASESSEPPATEDFLTYPPVEIPTDESGNFKCIVEYINNITRLQLSESEPAVDASNTLKEIIAEIQEEGGGRPVVDGMHQQKACIALFGDDRVWYRATILQWDLTKALVKVLYVDFGNWDIVAMENVRESKERWCSVAPRVAAADLHGVRESDERHIEEISAAYQRLFMSGELVATVLERTDRALRVELRRAVGEPLLYQPLIDKGLLEYTS